MLRHTWESWSLRARLLLSILLVLGTTVIGSGALFYFSSAATIERRTLALTEDTVNQMTKNVDLYVSEIERLSLTMFGDAIVQRVLRASDPDARERRRQQDVDDISYRMLTLAASWQSIHGMYIFANDGELFYFTRGPLPQRGYRIAEEPWYARMHQQTAPATLLWPTGIQTTVLQRGGQVFSHIRLIKDISTGKKLGYLKIDIDIAVMPEVDGLEIIQRLKARIPQLAAIVLSGYGEFEYARMGLRLGISDYLLKPVRTDALHQTVARALATITDERVHAAHVREAELARLLLGGLRAAGAELDLLAGEWGIIFILCENWESPTIWRDTAISRDFIRQAIGLLAPPGCDIVDIDARCRLVLVPLAGAQPHTLDTIAQRLHRAILAAGVIVHTTWVHKGAGERPERVVPEGLGVLARAMHFAAPTFARPGAAPEDRARDVAHKHTHLVARGLAEGRLSDAVAEVYAALNQLQHIGATQTTIIQTLDDLFEHLRRHVQSRSAELPAGREALTAAVRGCRTYAELVVWVDMQLQPILMRRGAATPRQLVRTLVALVHTAYAEDISLQAFAAERNVSLAYFSRLFKDEVGMTFSDYLTRVRIEKAKELLERLDVRLSEISILVGYDDPKYFSRIFRRVAGMSPLDYQRSRR